MAIENYISVLETEGPKFGVALEQHVKAYEVDIMNLQRAAKLVPGKSIQVELASGATLKAKSVILSTGARWREISVPGEREYRNRGVAYRSEERRVGKECVSTGRYRWAPSK